VGTFEPPGKISARIFFLLQEENSCAKRKIFLMLEKIVLPLKKTSENISVSDETGTQGGSLKTMEDISGRRLNASGR